MTMTRNHSDPPSETDPMAAGDSLRDVFARALSLFADEAPAETDSPPQAPESDSPEVAAGQDGGDETTDPFADSELTMHAQQRWAERTPAWSVDLQTAYRHSTPAIELKEKAFEMGGKQPDRVHLFGEHNGTDHYLAVLFVSEEAVTTVIDLDNLWSVSSPVRAYLRALGDQQGYTLPGEQRTTAQRALNPSG